MSDKQRVKVDPDLDFVQDLIDDGGDTLKKCFQCGTCSVVCNLAPKDNPFPRQEMIWAQWGLKDKLLADPNVWLCHHCTDCSEKCPRGAKPGEVLQAVRKKVIESVAWPPFMGKAVGDPHYLPYIFAVPALLLLAIMFGTGTADMNADHVEYGYMIGHYAMNGLFVPFTGLAALAFLIGLNSIWTGMSGNNLLDFATRSDKPKLVSAGVSVISEILAHRKFEQCDANRWRKLAHMLVLFAFIGLLIVTVLAIVVLVAVEFFDNTALGDYPLSWYHPIKWLANVSALALIGGVAIMIYNRANLAEKGVLSTSYFDNLLLWLVLGVGVTGFLSQVLRFANIPILAYPTYYLHLVLVFSLLIYSPYSKFAHMIYRTAVLIYIRYQELMAGVIEEAKPEKEEAEAAA